MTIIIIDIEYKNRFGNEKHFCTMVGNYDSIHGALMDCMNEIRKNGWRYIDHTITIKG